MAPSIPAVFDVTQGSLSPYIKSKGVYVCPDDSVGQVNGSSYSSCAAQFTAPAGTALFPENPYRSSTTLPGHCC